MTQQLVRRTPISPEQPAPPSADPAAVRRYCCARVGFGLIWALDATLKWLPGFRDTYPSMITEAAQGQPGWLAGWFSFWDQSISHAPTAFAVLIALAETAIALSLILGIAQRVGFGFGIVFALLIWGIGEGFGGPYSSGSADIGSAIMYAVLFAALWLAVPPAIRTAAPALDHTLAHHRSWRWVMFAPAPEPPADDTRHGHAGWLDHGTRLARHRPLSSRENDLHR